MDSHTRTYFRRKVIVIPFVHEAALMRLLVVKDRRTKEWTFVSGGCKAHESDVDAARRELKEETRGLLDLDIGSMPSSSFKFRSFYRDPKEMCQDAARGQRIVTCYTVYFANVTGVVDREAVQRTFRHIRNMKGVFNENTDLAFETLDEFEKKNHVWPFIREQVMANEHFRTLVRGRLDALPAPNKA